MVGQHACYLWSGSCRSEVSECWSQNEMAGPAGDAEVATTALGLGPVEQLACASHTAKTIVFSSRLANVSCYRIPVLVRTAQGTLLAFAEARHGPLLRPRSRRGGYTGMGVGCEDWNTQEIALRRSTDGGRTWSEVQFAVGNHSNPVGNPSPIALRSGRVVLIYLRRPSNCKTSDCGGQPHGNGAVFSDDDGLSWSEDSDVSSHFGAARGCMPGPGPGVELQGEGEDAGRLLVVSHCGPYMVDFVTYSNDSGLSWATAPQRFNGMDEGALADLGNGNVLLSMRHLLEGTLGRAMARSSDGGLTWGPVHYDPSLLGPTCQASMLAVGTEPRHLLFSNPDHKTKRINLSVKKSTDSGYTWSSRLLVQDLHSFGYSSLAPLSRDSLQGSLLFESSDPGELSEISFCTFPLDF